MPSATTVPGTEIPVLSGQVQHRLESADAQVVLCDHAKTCDSILYGDGVSLPNTLIRAFRRYFALYTKSARASPVNRMEE